MGRVFKILAIVVAAVVALFALAAIAFFLLFDPNDFREDIAAAVEERTGRELVIDGDVSLALFPWLAVEVGHARLGNAPDFGAEPFAEFDRARLSIRLMPLLLRREVAVGTAELEALRLNLAVNRAGRSNWEDLLAADAAEAPEADGEEAATGRLDISGVTIVDAAIRYEDRQAGETYRLSAVNLRIGRVSDDGSPVPASGSFSFAIEPDGMSGDIEIETIVAFGDEFVRLDGLDIEGAVTGIANAPTSIALSTDGIEIDTAKQVVTAKPLNVTALGLDIAIDAAPFSYADEVLPSAAIRVAPFSPQSLMHLLDIEAPATADPTALSNVSVEGKAALTAASIDLSSVTLVLDATTFKGSLSVPRSSAGSYRFDLSGDTLDLNRYMAPATEGSGEAAASAPTEIPADLIRPINARGNLKIGSVQLANLQLDNVVLGLNSGGGRLRLHPISADLYGGKYAGDVRLDVAGDVPILSVDEKVENVDLAKLAFAMFEQRNITGSINGNFKLTARGADAEALQRDLSGTMAFALKDGAFEGTDVWYELRRARALLKQETPPQPVLPARTPFSSVTATGVVTRGVMRNEDFVADLPFMRITGQGSVDLPAATVDYRLSARVFKKPEAMQGAAAEEIDDLTKVVIPLSITGPLVKPSVKPDVEKLLQQKVEEEVRERIEDKLKDLFKKKE